MLKLLNQIVNTIIEMSNYNWQLKTPDHRQRKLEVSESEHNDQLSRYPRIKEGAKSPKGRHLKPSKEGTWSPPSDALKAFQARHPKTLQARHPKSSKRGTESRPSEAPKALHARHQKPSKRGTKSPSGEAPKAFQNKAP